MSFRLAVGQMRVEPGDVCGNLDRALSFLEKAADADLLLLPEFCLGGYLVGDRWESPDFLRDLEEAGRELCRATETTGVLFGSVGIDRERRGRDGRTRLYNAAFCAWRGSFVQNPLLGVSYFPKTNLPDYREFEESRHFYDLQRLSADLGVRTSELIAPVEIPWEDDTLKLGVTLCEDGWSEDYTVHPVRDLDAREVAVQINLSASPFTLGKNEKRHRVFREHGRQTGCAVVYVNCVGQQNNGKTVFGFDGNSSVYNGAGELCGSLPLWEEAFGLLELDRSTWRSPLRILDGFHKAEEQEEDSQIYHCLKSGVWDYCKLAGIKKVVIGISGGIDSAVQAALFADVLGAENLLLVNMPSRYNSSLTKGLAASVAKNLGVSLVEIPIEDSVALTCRQIDGLVIKDWAGGNVQKLHLSDFALENVQARDRSSRILAALSSAVGGVFTCNANKTETSVGYSTLYGDHGGFLAALGDLWKEQVYDLGRYLNEKVYGRELIPSDIFNIPPSAELGPKQNVEAGQGDPLAYWYHDRLFSSWMQRWNPLAPADLLEAWLSGSLQELLDLPKNPTELFSCDLDFINDLERWWKLFRGMGVAKRIQAPPILAVSRRAYGFDFREAVMRPYFSRRYKELKAQTVGIT